MIAECAATGRRLIRDWSSTFGRLVDAHTCSGTIVAMVTEVSNKIRCQEVASSNGPCLNAQIFNFIFTHSGDVIKIEAK